MSNPAWKGTLHKGSNIQQRMKEGMTGEKMNEGMRDKMNSLWIMCDFPSVLVGGK